MLNRSRRIRATVAVMTICIVSAGAVRTSTGVRAIRRAAEGGRIEGTVILSNALAAKRPRFRIYSDAGKGATPPSQPAPELKDEYANVVLYLELDRGGALASGAAQRPVKPAIVQRGEKFVPHVLTILQGTSVDFPNEDDVFHNVFSLSSPRTFDLEKYPAGASKSVLFAKPGVVHVFCHIHADMSAVIVVRDNPYFVTPDATGKFTMENIPPGEYSLVAFHERITEVKHKVRIVAGQATRDTFNIPLRPADH